MKPTFKNPNFLYSFLSSWSGFRSLISEKAAQKELILLLISLAVVICDFNLITSTIVILSLILLGFEALNTAIEELCNFLTFEFDHRIKRIKDLAAAAIFCVSIALLFAWASYALQYFNILQMRAA